MEGSAWNFGRFTPWKSLVSRNCQTEV